jgi:hypothetical protein
MITPVFTVFLAQVVPLVQDAEKATYQRNESSAWPSHMEHRTAGGIMRSTTGGRHTPDKDVAVLGWGSLTLLVAGVFLLRSVVIQHEMYLAGIRWHRRIRLQDDSPDADGKRPARNHSGCKLQPAGKPMTVLPPAGELAGLMDVASNSGGLVAGDCACRAGRLAITMYAQTRGSGTD